MSWSRPSPGSKGPGPLALHPSPGRGHSPQPPPTPSQHQGPGIQHGTQHIGKGLHAKTGSCQASRGAYHSPAGAPHLLPSPWDTLADKQPVFSMGLRVCPSEICLGFHAQHPPHPTPPSPPQACGGPWERKQTNQVPGHPGALSPRPHGSCRATSPHPQYAQSPHV